MWIFNKLSHLFLFLLPLQLFLWKLSSIYNLESTVYSLWLFTVHFHSSTVAYSFLFFLLLHHHCHYLHHHHRQPSAITTMIIIIIKINYQLLVVFSSLFGLSFFVSYVTFASSKKDRPQSQSQLHSHSQSQRLSQSQLTWTSFPPSTSISTFLPSFLPAFSPLFLDSRF